MQNELLTIDEFAAALQVTRSCVRRWVGERKITTVKVGRLVRIPESELARIVSVGTRLAMGASRR